MTTTHYKLINGVFVEDKENYKKIGTIACTIYTGGIWILHNAYYDKIRNKYCGEHHGMHVELRPSEILCMRRI